MVTESGGFDVKTFEMGPECGGVVIVKNGVGACCVGSSVLVTTASKLGKLIKERDGYVVGNGS